MEGCGDFRGSRLRICDSENRLMVSKSKGGLIYFLKVITKVKILIERLNEGYFELKWGL